MRHIQPLRTGLFVTLVLTVWCCASSAPGQVAVRGVRGPWQVYARQGAWAQRVPVIFNNGDSTRRIRVVMPVQDPEQGTVHYTRTVSIPPHARRKAWMGCRFGRIEETDRSRRGGAGGVRTAEFAYQYWDAATGQRLDQAIAVATLVEDDQVGLAQINADPQAYEATNYLKDAPQHLLGEVRLMSAGAVNLPDSWYGYDMAGVVLLTEVRFNELRSSQLQALLDWTRRGGMLVILASEDIELMLSGELGLTAGVATTGFHYADELHVEDAQGRSFTSRTSLPACVAELAVGEAEVLFTVNGLPMITHRRIGAGHVFVSAVSGIGLRGEQMQEVWYQMHRVARGTPPLLAAKFEKPAAATLEQIAGVRGPDKSAPLTILLVLLAATLVGGLWLGKRRRGEWIWLTLVPVGILLGFGLYIYGKAQSQPEALSHVGLITDLGGGRARVQQAYAYYSGSDERQVSFRAGTPGAVIRDMGLIGDAGMGINMVANTPMLTLADRTVRPNATRAFYVDGVVEEAPLGGEVSFDEDGLIAALVNPLSADITDAVFYTNRRTLRAGELPAGRTSTIEIDWRSAPTRVVFPTPEQVRKAQREGPPSLALPRGSFTAGRVGGDPLRNDLVRRLAGWGPSVDDNPLLIGYTAADLLDPLARRDVARQGWSVITWPLEFSAPPAGSVAAIPFGFTRIERINSGTPVYQETSEQYIASPYPRELIIKASPPEGVGNLSDVTAVVRAELNATGYRLTVSGARVSPQRQVLSRTPIFTRDNPAGLIEVEVPDADRFGDDQGRLVFSLKVDRLGEADAPITEQVQWKFESVDVALKGTVR